MSRRVSHRFPTAEIANKVCAKLKQIVKGAECSVSLEMDDMTESDIKRGVGKWAIVFEFFHRKIPLYPSIEMMSTAVNAALTLALADELAEANPNNPLLQIWHINKENRPAIGKYDFSEN